MAPAQSESLDGVRSEEGNTQNSYILWPLMRILGLLMPGVQSIRPITYLLNEISCLIRKCGQSRQGHSKCKNLEPGSVIVLWFEHLCGETDGRCPEMCV